MNEEGENPLSDKFFSKPQEEYISAGTSESVNANEREGSGPGEPAYKSIAALAFRLYEQDGRPEGRSREYWERAREILKRGEAG